MGAILLILSLFLSIILYPFGLIYTIIRLAINSNIKAVYDHIDKILKTTAVALDETGNVFMQEVFNDILITKEGHQYGLPTETISSVCGKNKASNTLKPMGKALCWLLDTIQPNHVEDSIE